MPAEGSTPRLPFDGVIFRSAASGAACALAEAAAAAYAGPLRGRGHAAARGGEQAERRRCRMVA